MTISGGNATTFVQVVKQAQSKSEGVSEAAVESDQGDQAQLMVALNVKTTIGANNNPTESNWRMRINVHQTGDGPKVSNVEFVA